MIISEIAVRKRIGVIVFAIVILIAGPAAYLSMPRESAPDITIPYVFINTTYPGVAPVDIEQSITIPIEKKLKGLEGVEKITSSSSEGSSSIVVEFIAGIDIDEVLPKTKDKVDQANSELPGDLEDDPEVTEINISEMPIVVFSLSGTVDLVRLKEIAEDLEEEFEAVPGVLDAEVTGGLEREVRIEPFSDRLAYYGLSLVGLQKAISDENLNVSGGGIRMGDGRFQLRVPGEFESPEEIYGLVVGTHDGRPVYLKDVALVVDGFKDETGRSRLNGKRAVNIQVKKRAGENIIRITDEIDNIIEEQRHTWPKGTEVRKLMDQAKDIRLMVSDLENNILTGLFLVVLVLMFFLGIRNSILVSLAIPFSMFLSFMILHALDITLNMVVLYALTLSLGMLVDNAIVIVENIYRYMHQGVPRVQAAVKATSEVAWPVMASTLTTLAAFFPLMFWPGIMGEFMQYLPITLIVTLSSSLFVALVINPAMAAIFLRVAPGKKLSTAAMTAAEISKRGLSPITIKGPILKGYNWLLNSALNHRAAVMLMAILTLTAMIMIWLIVIGLEMPVEFFPDIEPKNIYVNFDMPEGADLEYSDRIARQAEIALCMGPDYGLASPDAEPLEYYEKKGKDKLHTLHTGEKVANITDMSNVKDVYSRVVSVGGGSAIFDQNSPNHLGIQFYEMEERIEPSSLTMDEIRERVVGIPGTQVTIAKQEEGPPTGAPINIEISGDNLDVMGQIAQTVRSELEKINYVQDIRDDYLAGSPTVKLRIDRQKAAMMGLSTNTVGFALKVAFKGLKVSTFREGDDDYDITIQLPEEDRKRTDILRELLIPTEHGLVPLSTIAWFEVTGGLGQINRIDHKRIITIKAEVDAKNASSTVIRAEAEKKLAEFDIPPGYQIRFTGEQDEQAKSQAFLMKAFVAAIFLIVLILVTLFNSVSQPIIIMTSVVLALGGVFLGLSVMEYPFGIIMTGVGVISLAGVVVNNSIVLIDYTNQLRARGMAARDAIISAGCTRLRPVLLTAVTTILGLIPMVTGVSYDFHTWEMSWVSESTQWWSSMAIAVIFGLAFATALTLLVVPTLYSLFFSAGKTGGRWVNGIRRAWWAPFYKITGLNSDGDERF